MRIIIRNLGSKTTEADVRDRLNDYGDITISQVKSVVEQGNGRIMTCAYVVTNDRTSGEALIAGFNNKEIDGQKLTVKEAR